MSFYFLLINAFHYAVASCLSVRLSVCHTPIFCQTITHILKLISPSGSQTILVFPYQKVC